VHSFLFLFYRKESGSLYLAVSALGFALFMAVEARAENALGGDVDRVLGVLAVAGISIMILGFIRFGHYFVNRPSPRVMAFFVVAATIAVASNAISGDVVTPQIIALLSLVELARGLVRGVLHPPGPRAWVVGIGFLAILLSAAIETLSGLGVLPSTFLGSYKYGMLFLFVTLSVYLSWRFADTRLDLEQRLLQVESLTQQAVEQERQAQLRNMERQLLELDHDRQRSELEAARRLQLSMLPESPPTHPDLEVDFKMKTASEVGGDYYDFQEHADGSLTLAIGDATGHGLDAGLVVATTKGLFHAAAEAPTLELVLSQISQGLAGLNLKRRNMSLLLFRWSGGELQAISAGMPPAWVHQSRSGEIHEWLSGAPPLPALREHEYRSGKLRFEVGDTLLTCSDGLPERPDSRGEILGYERLEQSFREVASGSLEETREHLFAFAENWADGRPRQDDETVLLMRRRR
jgi:serine phosphatase RsbU (regulator of sigma subunit)